MRATWLPDVLRAADVPVIEMAGWRGRGRDMKTIRGVIGHDTVTRPSVTDEQVARILRDGHSTLAGPLAQCGLDRIGRWWVIADGRCHHNGYGTWGNDTIGVEVFCNGGAIPVEPWNAAQRDSYVRGTRAVLAHLGMDERRTLGHKESDPGRKIDPWDTSMPAIRIRINQPPAQEWDVMATRDEVKHALIEAFDEAVFLAEHAGKQYIVRETNQTATHITTGAEFDKLRRAFPHRGSLDVTAEYEVIA